MVKLVLCPFKKGNLVTLTQQYTINEILEETQKYWLFEATQITTQQTVLIKIYINERFTSIDEVESTWENEIAILQSEAEDQPLPIDYIESGTISITGEKLFVIIFNYIETPEKKTIERLEEKEAIIEDIKSIVDEEVPIISSIEKMESLSGEEAVDEFESIKRRESIESRSAYEMEKEEEAIAKSSPLPSKPAAPTTTATPTTPAIPSTGGGAPLRTVPEKKAKKKPSSSEMAKEKSEYIEIDVEEEKDYLKHISMEYFDRMNPQNYYPLTLNISDIIQKEISPEVNILTGERKIQTQSQLEASLKTSAVIVRPTIPGCNVVPREIETDFDQDTDEITFYVTPGVKGEIIGHIEFINEGKVFHTTELKAKVVDPNYARIVAFYGILASFVPKILSILGMDIGLDSTINTLSATAIAVVGDMNIASLIAIGGILPVLVVSLIVRQRLKPKSKRVQYRLKDFRLKNLEFS